MDAQPKRATFRARLCLVSSAFCVSLLLAGNASTCIAASYRTANFIVSAPTAEFAQKTGDLAEQYRRDLAVEWLGHELPRWRRPCPITVEVGRMGAGGATSFMFENGRPFNWTMNIQGPPDRVLDAVLPHEITHTIFATHFGRPLPRWADEGACTTVEHISERKKQERMLITFLTTGRGIAFNKMFAMTEYPHDVMPLYSQGYSLARYLIAQGGKQKFVKYVGDGMNYSNWTTATKKHYGFKNLSELQTTWLDWVRRGSPMDQFTPQSNIQLATHTTPATQSIPSAVATPIPGRRNLQPVPGASPLQTPIQPVAPRQPLTSQPAPQHLAEATGGNDANSSDTESTGGWYKRQHDIAQNRIGNLQEGQRSTLSRPQPPAGPGTTILEWGAQVAPAAPPAQMATTPVTPPVQVPASPRAPHYSAQAPTNPGPAIPRASQPRYYDANPTGAIRR